MGDVRHSGAGGGLSQYEHCTAETITAIGVLSSPAVDECHELGAGQSSGAVDLLIALLHEAANNLLGTVDRKSCDSHVTNCVLT